MVGAQRRHDHHAGRHLEINALKARHFENEPTLGRVESWVVRGLANVAQTKGVFTHAVQEERYECRRGGLPLRARQGHDARPVRLLKPEVESGRDGHAVKFQIENVGASPRDAGTL
jgi:hypothetical protein